MQGTSKTFAMVSLFSDANALLLKQSSGALAVCKYKGQESLKVIPTSSIITVVAMVPFPGGEDQNEFFLVEKLGLEIAFMSGYVEQVLGE